MFILLRPHVSHFGEGNQTVWPTLKNKSSPPVMPKQRKRCIVQYEVYKTFQMTWNL
jgi:hypothetical protein